MAHLHNRVLLSGKNKQKKKKKKKPMISLNFIFAFKWMELDKIILSLVNLTQKDKHGMYSLISGH